MRLLDRILRRKDGAQEAALVQPPPVGAKCPHCDRLVGLNELVRSPYHILGCRYCYTGGA